MSALVGGHDPSVAAARLAARNLAVAVESLAQAVGPSVDLRRLTEDTARIAVDLDLLTGGGGTVRPVATLETIQDSEYPAAFFEGADDEGLGPRRR